MRKILIYFILLIFICFSIPIIFTSNFSEKASTQEAVENEIANSQTNAIEESKYNYSKYGTVKLLHTDNDEVEKLPIDEYLYGVVSAEMPASFEEEALKAQAVVARTYTIYKIIHNGSKHGSADICDDSTCCQAWKTEKDRKDKWDDDEKESNWNKKSNQLFG